MSFLCFKFSLFLVKDVNAEDISLAQLVSAHLPVRVLGELLITLYILFHSSVKLENK